MQNTPSNEFKVTPIDPSGKLSRLLAQENITFRYSPKATTAYFNLKTRVLNFPMWHNISPQLRDMILVHEVGHAIDTPYDKWIEVINDFSQNNGTRLNPETVKRIFKDYLNVVEDARIDRLQKFRYPGCRSDYEVGYKELFDKDFFGLAKSGQNINSRPFIDRLNIYFKGGHDLGINFSTKERSFINDIVKAQTFDDVVDLAKEIFLFSQKQKKQSMQNALGIGDLLEFTDEGDSLPSENNSEEIPPEETNSEEIPPEEMERPQEDVSIEYDSTMETVEDDAIDIPKCEEFEKSSVTEGGSKDINDVDSTLPEDEKDYDEPLPDEVETLNKFEQSLIDSAKSTMHLNNDITYVCVPYIENLEDIRDSIHDYKSFLDDYAQKNLVKSYESAAKLRIKLQKSVNFLAKEFEQRKAAVNYKRAQVSRTGVINTSVLHKYKISDDIFKKLTTIPDGKNHGMVLFLDWSGSMGEILKKTYEQLLMLTLFCRKVNIPFEVYTFTNRCGHFFGSTDYKFSRGKDNHLNICDNILDFKYSRSGLRNIFSSRMNSEEFSRASAIMTYIISNISYAYNSLDSLGGTPLDTTIVMAEAIINDFVKKNKIEVMVPVFLTDGMSDSPVYEPLNNNVTASTKRRDMVFVDGFSGKQYACGKSNGDRTSALLKILKDRTGSYKTVGFYLAQPGKFSGIPYEISVNNHEFYKKNGFSEEKNSGYDSYYVINTKAFKDIKPVRFYNPNVDVGSVVSTITEEFAEAADVKKRTFMVLGRFINNIA